MYKGALRNQKVALDPLKLELQMIVSCPVGRGNGTCKGNSALNHGTSLQS